MSKVSVVVGGQFGSEGKGAVAGHLSQGDDYSVIGVRVAGPNAGHTVYGNGPDGEDNYAWKLRTVPVTAVTNPLSTLIIAAGSEIDFDVLRSEIDALDKAGYNASDRLFIDREATVIDDKHIRIEQTNTMHERLGSTAKGIGAARAARIMRTAELYGGDVDTTEMLNDSLNSPFNHIIIEGTQGYGLGSHAGYYPFCTSSDCRAIDFLAMAGISPWHAEVTELDVWVVARTHPIRVAGNSGPLLGETNWEQLGLPEERTTVTNKVRRVGKFDPELVAEAVRANGGAPTARLALTMFDYVFPHLAGATIVTQEDEEVVSYIKTIQHMTGASVALVGTSPTTMAALNW
jgi:adenylosuccinate synthase